MKYMTTKFQNFPPGDIFFYWSWKMMHTFLQHKSAWSSQMSICQTFNISLSLSWKTASNLRIPIVLSLIFLFTDPWLKKKKVIHVLILSHRFLVHTIFILVLCPLECLMYLLIYHPKTATFYHILEEIYTPTNGKSLVYCWALSNYILKKIIIKNLWWKNWNQTAKIMEVELGYYGKEDKEIQHY